MRGAKAAQLMCMAGLMALSACGGGSAGTSRSFEPATTSISSAGQARAEAMLLTSADLPAAWTSAPDTSDPHDRCVDGSGLTLIGRASSREFARTDAGYDIHVQSRAAIFGSEEQAKMWFDRLGDDRLLRCLRQNFIEQERKHPNPDVTVNVLEAERLPVASAGDGTSAFRLPVSVTQSGETTTVYVDAVYIRVGDAATMLVLVNAGEPFDDTEARSGSPSTADLVSAMADRMASAEAP